MNTSISLNIGGTSMNNNVDLEINDKNKLNPYKHQCCSSINIVSAIVNANVTVEIALAIAISTSISTNVNMNKMSTRLI